MNKKVRKKPNKRVIIGTLAIILALVSSYIIVPMLTKASEEKCDAIRISRTVERGQVITDADIEVVRVNKASVPEEAVLKKDEVVGRYAVFGLLKGDYVINGKLSESPISANEYLWELQDGELAMSVAIPDFAAGLSAKLETGDLISVIAVRKDNNSKKSTDIPEELKYVEILAVTTESGTDIDAQELIRNVKNSTEGDELPQTITLRLTQGQAKALAALDDFDVALAYRGNDEERKRAYLNLQKWYLETVEVVQDIQDSIDIMDAIPDAEFMEENDDE